MILPLIFALATSGLKPRPLTVKFADNAPTFCGCCVIAPRFNAVVEITALYVALFLSVALLILPFTFAEPREVFKVRSAAILFIPPFILPLKAMLSGIVIFFGIVPGGDKAAISLRVVV